MSSGKHDPAGPRQAEVLEIADPVFAHIQPDLNG